MSLLSELFFPEDKRYGHWEGPNGESCWLKGQGVWRAHTRFKKCHKCGGSFWLGKKREDYYENPQERLAEGEVVCSSCLGTGKHPHYGQFANVGCGRCREGVISADMDAWYKRWDATRYDVIARSQLVAELHKLKG